MYYVDAEQYNSFHTTGSHHHAISMMVQLNLRVTKPKHQGRYDWRTFATDPDLQQRYTVEVLNCFQIPEVEEDPSEKYQRFVEAKNEATDACVPKMERTRHHLPSKHLAISLAMKRVDKVRLKHLKMGSVEDSEHLKEAKEFSTYD